MYVCMHICMCVCMYACYMHECMSVCMQLGAKHCKLQCFAKCMSFMNNAASILVMPLVLDTNATPTLPLPFAYFPPWRKSFTVLVAIFDLFSAAFDDF